MLSMGLGSSRTVAPASGQFLGSPDQQEDDFGLRAAAVPAQRRRIRKHVLAATPVAALALMIFAIWPSANDRTSSSIGFPEPVKKAGNMLVPVKEVVANIFNPVKEAAGDIVKPVKEIAVDFVKPVKEAADDFVKPVKEAAGNIVQPVKEVAGKVAGNIVESGKDAAGKLAPAAKATAEIVWKHILPTPKPMKRSHLVGFYGEWSLESKRMRYLANKLEEEKPNVHIVWLDVRDVMNEHLRASIDIRNQCGGVPYLFNRKTGKILCGVHGYDKLRAWALGLGGDARIYRFMGGDN